jgi:hypothetical protein
MTETLELSEADGSASGDAGSGSTNQCAATRRVLGDEFRALSIAVLRARLTLCLAARPPLRHARSP